MKIKYIQKNCVIPQPHKRNIEEYIKKMKNILTPDSTFCFNYGIYLIGVELIAKNTVEYHIEDIGV